MVFCELTAADIQFGDHVVGVGHLELQMFKLMLLKGLFRRQITANPHVGISHSAARVGMQWSHNE